MANTQCFDVENSLSRGPNKGGQTSHRRPLRRQIGEIKVTNWSKKVGKTPENSRLCSGGQLLSEKCLTRTGVAYGPFIAFSRSRTRTALLVLRVRQDESKFDKHLTRRQRALGIYRYSSKYDLYPVLELESNKVFFVSSV